jgi:hypothetical protein
MRLPSRKKLQIMGAVLGLLTRHFTVVSMREHARLAGANASLPLRQPVFEQSS